MMKVFILIDANNIVRCLASEEKNLHPDKRHLKKYLVEMGGIVGDEYDPDTDTWIKRPGNYPQPSAEETREALIREKIRSMAVAELKKEGVLK